MKLDDVTKRSIVEDIESWTGDSNLLLEDKDKTEKEVDKTEKTETTKTVKDIIDRINGKVNDKFIIISDNVDSKRFSDEQKEEIKSSKEYSEAQKVIRDGIKVEGNFGEPENETSYIVKDIDSESGKTLAKNLGQDSFIIMTIKGVDKIESSLYDYNIENDDYVNSQTVSEIDIDKNFEQYFTKLGDIYFKIKFVFDNKEDNDKLETKENSEMKVHEQNLTEKKWRYVIKKGVDLRQAVEDEDSEGIRQALIDCYKEMFDNDLISEDDFDEYTQQVEDAMFEDEDGELDEDEIDFELDQLYDLCDNINVFVALPESLEEDKDKDEEIDVEDEVTDTEETETETEEDIDIDIEALESYANMEVGEDVTITDDLKDILQKSLEMAKLYKEEHYDKETSNETDETEEETDETEIIADVDLEESKKINESANSSLYDIILKKLSGTKITKDNIDDCAKKVGMSVKKLYDVLDDMINDMYISGNNETLNYIIPLDESKKLKEDTTTFEVDDEQPEQKKEEPKKNQSESEIIDELIEKGFMKLDSEDSIDLYDDLKNNKEYEGDLEFAVNNNNFTSELIQDIMDNKNLTHYPAYSEKWDEKWDKITRKVVIYLDKWFKYVKDNYLDESLLKNKSNKTVDESNKSVKDSTKKLDYVADKNDKAIDDLKKANTSDDKDGMKKATKDIKHCAKKNQEVIDDLDKELNEDNKKTNEDLVITSELSEFRPWGQAVEIFEKIESLGKLDELEFMLEDLYPDGLTKTQLNDILAYDWQWVYDSLNISDSDEEYDDISDLAGVEDEEEVKDTEEEDDDLDSDGIDSLLDSYNNNRDELTDDDVEYLNEKGLIKEEKKDRVEMETNGREQMTQNLKDTMKKFFDRKFGKDFFEDGEYGLTVDDEDGNIVVHVYAEVGYQTLDELTQQLDKVIKKFSEDAYFDHEDSGRLIAYIK